MMQKLLGAEKVVVANEVVVAEKVRAAEKVGMDLRGKIPPLPEEVARHPDQASRTTGHPHDLPLRSSKPPTPP
jgi:hypothetical protein